MSAAGSDSGPLPTDVLVVPSAFGRPPTQSRQQELPFAELAWDIPNQDEKDNRQEEVNFD